MAKLPFGLQLYSVREALQSDVTATLKRIKEIGYDHVETAGTAGLAPDAFRAALDEAGLAAVSAHVSFAECREHLDQAIDGCRALGVGWAVVSQLPAGERDTLDGCIACASEMASFGKAFQEAGVQLCFHNHVEEFRETGGKTHFDAIFETAAAEFLAVELDAGWAHYAGADALSLLKKYAGRTPLVHVKDVKRRAEGEEAVTTELGNGATPCGPLLRAAGETGVSWLFVEQDESARDPLESARMNAAYMRVHVF